MAYAPVVNLEPEPEPSTDRIRTPAFVIGIGIALAAVLIIALGIRSFISGIGTAVQKKNQASASYSANAAPGARRAAIEARSDFDLTIDANGDPLGLAWGDGEFVFGNRNAPWGFFRFKPVSDTDFTMAQGVQVYEPNGQQLGFRTVSWNGKQYVGYSDAGSLDKNYKNTFSVHDPKNLGLSDYFPAPELIGGLAWDGSGYWAATRRTGPDTREPAFLYRLDQHFNVLGRYNPPAAGCQGLAWDGTSLWWADVFTGNIYIIRVDGSKPEVVHTYHTNIDSLSGITFDGSNVWVIENREKKLRRLNPRLRQMWSAGDYRIASYEAATTALEPTGGSTVGGKSKDELLRIIKDDPSHSREAFDQLEKLGARDQAVAVLQELVRSNDERLRLQARDALRQVGVLPTYDRYVNSFSRTGDDADAIETSAEITGDRLRGSWRLYFGSQIFANTSTPAVARYKVIVKGGSLSSPLVKEYEARAGDNVRTNEELASSLAPGRYTIEFAIDAQFLDSNGVRKVLNRNIPSLEVGR